MKRPRIITIFLSIISFLAIHVHSVFGWHDSIHIAVAKAAGYDKWYYVVGPDMTKTKAGSIERFNHFFDNSLNVEVTHEMIHRQVMRYNNPNHSEGHLYGAIIASLREYKSTFENGKYAEYHVGFCAHYITDLTQPFHNIPYDDFNKSHHVENDGIVEKEVLKNIKKIKRHMYAIHLGPAHFENDLANEIARIANQARLLGNKLKKENRNMTREEAYTQLGHSASLLQAVLRHMGKQKNK